MQIKAFSQVWWKIRTRISGASLKIRSFGKTSFARKISITNWSSYLAGNEALDGKRKEDRPAEHDPGEVHEIVGPAVVLHEIALNVAGEGRVASDAERRSDEEGGEERPVRHDVPLFLGGALDRAVDQEGVVVAHEREGHYADGGNDAGQVAEPPGVLMARPTANRRV